MGEARTAIGVTGHRRLEPAVCAYVEAEIRDLLSRQSGPVVGLSSLAAGADQLFAEILLNRGGALHAVIPARGYESSLDQATRNSYRRLITAAETVTMLDFDDPTDHAYDAAGRFVVENCDLLVAVWDGMPARGLGGTGDAVTYARRLDRGVVVCWPEGVVRD